jgi:hypothetical protein
MLASTYMHVMIQLPDQNSMLLAPELRRLDPECILEFQPAIPFRFGLSEAKLTHMTWQSSLASATRPSQKRRIW